MKRAGYYVEDRFYRDNFHQARARAIFLSQEYGRPVEVKHTGHDGVTVVVLTAAHYARRAA
jgi:hypothetical protein